MNSIKISVLISDGLAKMAKEIYGIDVHAPRHVAYSLVSFPDACMLRRLGAELHDIDRFFPIGKGATLAVLDEEIDEFIRLKKR